MQKEFIMKRATMTFATIALGAMLAVGAATPSMAGDGGQGGGKGGDEYPGLDESHVGGLGFAPNSHGMRERHTIRASLTARRALARRS